MELDGNIHNEPEEYDKFRDEEMKLKGLHVLRIKNECVHSHTLLRKEWEKKGM